MARTKVDIITCDRCGRTLTEEDALTIEFSILYHDPFATKVHEVLEAATETDRIPNPADVVRASTVPQPAPMPLTYYEVCKRCDTLLRKLEERALPPDKPGRPRKEKEDE